VKDYARRLRPRVSAPTKRALVGLLALPLSTLPFVAYAHLTSEGALLSAIIHEAILPPKLPQYSPATVAALRAGAPHWSGLAAVLVYHGMGASVSEESTSISPEHFADQIATLKASGMNPVTAADLAAARSQHATLPDNAVLVTFDDGRTDAFLWADPVLEQANWQATMFVITAQASTTSLYYKSWGDIADLAHTGRWDIESHSAAMHYEQDAAGGRTLPALTSLSPGETLPAYRTRVNDDLTSSAETISGEVGTVPHAFAYPFGAYGAERDNDPRLQAVLATAVRSHFTLGFEQDDQSSVPLTGCSGNPLLIRRLEVGDWSGQQLIDRLSAMAAEPTSASAVPCRSPR
jgi:peptidoglycan/xylan/chitin deacetylase (PgdA/CDA1 family)